MKYKALHAISIMGTRFEIGDIVDINDDIAKSLDRNDVIPLEKVIAEPQVTNAVVVPVGFEKLKKDELEKLCKKLGLSSEGKKSDLIERIELSKIKV